MHIRLLLLKFNARVFRWYPVDDIYRSTNGGASWISVSATALMNVSSYPYLTFGGTDAKFGWWMGVVQIDPFNSNRYDVAP